MYTFTYFRFFVYTVQYLLADLNKNPYKYVKIQNCEIVIFFLYSLFSVPANDRRHFEC